MAAELGRRPCVVHEGVAALLELRAKGIPPELLIQSAQSGFVERLNAEPPFDPTTAAGTDAWRYPVRSLRKGFAGLGWRLDDVRNLPLVISDEQQINITVSSGDEYTGIDSQRHPRTKNTKGVLMEEAVFRNVGQLDLFANELPEAIRMFSQTIKYQTWVFLLFITDEEIRAELSLPSVMGNDHVIWWDERILLSVPLPGAESDDEIDYDEGPDIRPIVTPKI